MTSNLPSTSSMTTSGETPADCPASNSEPGCGFAGEAQELPALLDVLDAGAGLLGDLRQLVHRQVVEVVLDDTPGQGPHELHVVELHQQAVAQVARADAGRLQFAHDPRSPLRPAESAPTAGWRSTRRSRTGGRPRRARTRCARRRRRGRGRTPGCAPASSGSPPETWCARACSAVPPASCLRRRRCRPCPRWRQFGSTRDSSWSISAENSRCRRSS